MTPSLVTSGFPSLSMEPPDAHSQDMMSFWAPLGTAVSSGRAHPETLPPRAVIFLAASRNSVRVLGTAETPALVSRSWLTNSG